jgi:hypothetical protein
MDGLRPQGSENPATVKMLNSSPLFVLSNPNTKLFLYIFGLFRWLRMFFDVTTKVSIYWSSQKLLWRGGRLPIDGHSVGTICPRSKVVNDL